MINVGASIVDITPPIGLAMAGFAVRSDVAVGVHDALTARALVVDDTAIVTVDVIGVDAALSQRVRSRCSLPKEAVTILATHTHGGPASMPGRLWVETDTAFMRQLENGIVQAIAEASAARQPAHVFSGTAVDPGYSKNRRHADGPVDRGVPILRFDSTQGKPIAIFISNACHPVVLGADNLSWTGDFPHFARQELEAELPGVIALFATGCAGDVNTGHSAASSLTNEPKADRSFSMAKTIGVGIAQSVLSTELAELTGNVGTAEVMEQLEFQQREMEPARELAKQWGAQASGGDAIAQIWADWAADAMGKNMNPLNARCTALNWCGAQIVAMPGELFAQTAIEIRQSMASDESVFVLGYADDNPGYIPHQAAYSHGGYEVEEAHRFYGLGATFAPGSAERLAQAGCKAARIAMQVATGGHQPK